MRRRILFRWRNDRFAVGVKIAIRWPDVGTSARFFPLADEFVLEDFRASFARQASFIKTEFAHLHVISSSDKQYRWFVRMQFHLAGDPLTVEVSVPLAFLVAGHIRFARFHERNAEETLRIRCNQRGARTQLRFAGSIQNLPSTPTINSQIYSTDLSDYTE